MLALESRAMWEWLAKVPGVKQGSGIVGMLCSASLLAFAAMAVAAYSISKGGWTAAAALVCVLIISVTLLVVVSKMLDHAKKDPLGAGMESAHLLLAYNKLWELASRDQGALVPTVNIAAQSIQTGPPQVGQPALTEIVKESAQ